MLCSSCNNHIKPVVAFDIDGVLGDYHAHFTDFCMNYWQHTRLAPGPYDGSMEFEEWLGLSKIEYREAKLAYRQGGLKRWLPVFGDAGEVVNDVRSAGAEVWIATTRPWQRLDNIDPDTREWLRRAGLPYDGLLYGDDKYNQLCEAVGDRRIMGVADDLLVQCQIADKLGLPIIQIDRWHNSHSSQRFYARGTLLNAAHMMIRNIEGWKVQYG